MSEVRHEAGRSAFMRKWEKFVRGERLRLNLMMLPGVVFVFLFNMMTLLGIAVAFQDFIPRRGWFGSEWVGLRNFRLFFEMPNAYTILRNTLVLNLMNLAMGFWVPIVFAITVNEIPFSPFKKFTQTVSYMPNFISSVVVAGMVISFIANDGIITRMINGMGFQVKSLNANAGAFPWVYTLTNVWKNFGWSSILYLSSITAIDPALYESAEIDGATRLQKIWFVTLPFMLPLIVIQLIFAVGGMLSSNTDMVLLLYNSAVYSTADVIGTYVYRESLLGAKYSYGTASGLILSVMSFILVYAANWVSRRLTDFSLW